MNERRILGVTLALCAVLLVICGLLIAANEEFLAEPYHPEWVLEEAEVPTQLVAHVRSTFPTVSNMIWELDGGEYEASFILSGRKVEVYYDKDLNWMKTERTASLEALPEPARTFMIQEAGNEWEFYNVEMIQSPNSLVAWEVQLKSGFYEWNYQFDGQGRFLGKKREIKVDAEELVSLTGAESTSAPVPTAP